MQHRKLCTLILALLSSAVAQANDSTQPSETGATPSDRQTIEDRNAWHFTVTPYLWMTSMSGEERPFKGGPKASVDTPFSEILKHLDMGFFTSFTARQDRLVFLGDLTYASLSADEKVENKGTEYKVTASARQLNATMLAGYRVVEKPSQSLDLMGGVRAWQVNTRVEVRGDSNTLEKASDTFSWADPIVALSYHRQFNERISAMLYADTGGLGVGSDFTWQVLATVGYHLTPSVSVSAGYRQLVVDYDRSGHVYDMTLRGPLLGLSYSF